MDAQVDRRWMLIEKIEKMSKEQFEWFTDQVRHQLSDPAAQSPRPTE